MRKIHGLSALALIYTLLLVGAVIVPPWITIPVGLAVSLILIYGNRIDRRRKILDIQKRLNNLKSEGLVIDESFRGDEDDVFYRVIIALLTDLERSLFKLVEKNIQLLSLKEIGRSIISSLDEKKLIDSIFDYLGHGVGYRETAFILLRKSRQMFQAVVNIDKTTSYVRRTLSFELEEMEGAVYKSLCSGKPYLIKDIQMHPLFVVRGEPIFPRSTMTSYICVPLLKSADQSGCKEYENCPVKKSFPDIEGNPYMKNKECLSCPCNPLLGAVIVTDGFRSTPLTNIDQVTIETVGSLASSNIENWQLYMELRQEEVFRENVLEGMINGVFVVNLEGDITLANKSAREMSEHDFDDLFNMNIRELILDASGGERSSPVHSSLEEGLSLAYYEAYLKRADGIHIPIRMNVSPMMGEEDEIQGAIIEFVDLSEIKRMEEEIRQLDRLAALGRFTSAVAHEVRNPLAGIAAGIQYLNRDENLNSDQRENISFVLNEVDRLNRIVTDLFKVAKPRSLLYGEAKLEEVIDRSYMSVNEIFSNNGIEFHMDIDDNLPLIEVDQEQIVQVMINLLKNAAEAVDKGGIVSVTSSVYKGGDPEVIREKDREMICVVISDNGQGIEAEDLEKIFEPFYSNKKDGTGLGLFVTHSIIQHHQGRITATSEIGKGTTFRIYLPIERPRKGEEIEAGRTTG